MKPSRLSSCPWLMLPNRRGQNSRTIWLTKVQDSRRYDFTLDFLQHCEEEKVIQRFFEEDHVLARARLHAEPA